MTSESRADVNLKADMIDLWAPGGETRLGGGLSGLSPGRTGSAGPDFESIEAVAGAAEHETEGAH